jgi:uncharacterized membrane protein HdeD (DUF308 family)
MQTLFKKWWIILLQGVMLVALSIYMFSNPEATLLAVTYYLSLLVLIAGSMGVWGWLLASESERDIFSLLWSSLSTLFGILLLAKIGFAMDLLTKLVGTWMILTGAWLAKQGWENSGTNTLGVIALLTGLVSVITGLVIIFNIGAGAVAVSTILGIQLLFAGIGLIMLGLVKKQIVSGIKNAAAGFRDEYS